MKALLAFLALAVAAQAQTPLVIYQPAPVANVVSPLTNPTAQSNQALLNQINSTMSQRFFEHQVLTLQTSPGPLNPSDTPRLIQAR
jgi:hypothetical protein